jgi:hypothetical protein
VFLPDRNLSDNHGVGGNFPGSPDLQMFKEVKEETFLIIIIIIIQTQDAVLVQSFCTSERNETEINAEHMLGRVLICRR